MLEFPGNVFGLAMNLERDSVGAVVLGEYEGISEGDTAVSYTHLRPTKATKKFQGLSSRFGFNLNHLN